MTLPLSLIFYAHTPNLFKTTLVLSHNFYARTASLPVCLKSTLEFSSNFYAHTPYLDKNNLSTLPTFMPIQPVGLKTTIVLSPNFK